MNSVLVEAREGVGFPGAGDLCGSECPEWVLGAGLGFSPTAANALKL